MAVPMIHLFDLPAQLIQLGMLVFGCFAVEVSDTFEVGGTVVVHTLLLMILNVHHRYAYMNVRHNVRILRKEFEKTLLHVDAV